MRRITGKREEDLKTINGRNKQLEEKLLQV